MVAKRAGRMATIEVHHGLLPKGGITQPLPDQVGLSSPGTFNLGVSTPTYMSTMVMDKMAMSTAKSDTKFLTLVVKKLPNLNFLRCQEMRKVPMKSKTLIKYALGT